MNMHQSCGYPVSGVCSVKNRSAWEKGPYPVFCIHYVFQRRNRSNLYAGKKFETAEYILGDGIAERDERVESDSV